MISYQDIRKTVSCFSNFSYLYKSVTNVFKYFFNGNCNLLVVLARSKYKFLGLICSFILLRIDIPTALAVLARNLLQNKFKNLETRQLSRRKIQTPPALPPLE